MSIEIEPKFLIKHDRWKSLCTHTIRIRDGLFAGSKGLKVRVRIADHRATIALKGPERVHAR